MKMELDPTFGMKVALGEVGNASGSMEGGVRKGVMGAGWGHNAQYSTTADAP